MPKFVAGEGLTPSLAAHIVGSRNWFMGRVIDALSQIPTARPEHRAEMFAVARQAIAAMHASTLTAVAAFDEVMRECPPPPTADDPKAGAGDPFATMRVRPAEDTPLPFSRVEVTGAAADEPLIASVSNGALAPPDDTKPKKGK
jgi:hypothetical protein